MLIVQIIVGWFILSIVVSLIVARFLAASNSNNEFEVRKSAETIEVNRIRTRIIV